MHCKSPSFVGGRLGKGGILSLGVDVESSEGCVLVCCCEWRAL